MKKITVHVTSRLECSYSSGGVRSISHVWWWDLVLFAPSVPQKGSLPARWDPCAAPITLEHWDEKEQVPIFRSRRIAEFIFPLWVPGLTSALPTRCESWCGALLGAIPGLGAVRGSLSVLQNANERWMELFRASCFTLSNSHPADLILSNICGSALRVRCLLL